MTEKTPRKAAPRIPDAIKMLMQDHKDVKERFKEYEKLVKSEAEGDEKQALAGQICDMLKMHTQLEEEHFYPAAREVLAEGDMLDEAEVEHASAKDLIAQIEGGSPSDDLYDAKVKVLGEYIDHHVKEEEKEMFPKIRKTGLDLRALGEAMQLRKEELQEEAGEKAPALTH
jgi:DUF438 domain-containing protein